LQSDDSQAESSAAHFTHQGEEIQMTSNSSTSDRSSASGTTRRATNGSVQDRLDDAKTAIRTAGDQVGVAVTSVRETVPEVARASRDFLDDAMKRIEAGSDQQVSAGVTLSLGLAIGMLVGGAPRLFVAAALVPVAAMGLVLMDRRALGRSATSTSNRSAG
jgi:hypothetical protein